MNFMLELKYCIESIFKSFMFESSRTPLHLTAISPTEEWVDIIRLLIKNGTDMTICCIFGNLSWKMTTDEYIIRLLIEFADVDTLNYQDEPTWEILVHAFVGRSNRIDDKKCC